jgi:hypothetical protein
MADNRADIAIATAEAISSLIESEIVKCRSIYADKVRPLVPEDLQNQGELPGLERARMIAGTFIAATRVQQAPKRGRPRGQKAEP